MAKGRFFRLSNKNGVADRAVLALRESFFGAGCFFRRVNNLGVMTDGLDYFNLCCVIAVFALLICFIAVLKAGSGLRLNILEVMVFLDAECISCTADRAGLCFLVCQKIKESVFYPVAPGVVFLGDGLSALFKAAGAAALNLFLALNLAGRLKLCGKVNKIMLNAELVLCGNNKVTGDFVKSLVPLAVEFVMSALIPIEV